MLVIKDLCVTFNKGTTNEKKVLEHFNLTLNKGDFLTIVGSNGSGKSTLSNALLNLVNSSGKIYLDNVDITKQKTHTRCKKIGILFQDPLKGTAPSMTIYENMILALGKSYSKAKIKDLIKGLELNLEDRLDMKVGLLSGGQRQAISLLMSSINTPSLLLLDEHTASLDPKTAKKIMEITQKIVEEKSITTIMITHNMKDAIKYGNKLLFLKNGNIYKFFRDEEKSKLKIEDLYALFEG